MWVSPFPKEVDPTPLQITPQCWSVFSWGSFPAMSASTENLIWGQLLKNSYLLTQLMKLFHHFCNFKSHLHADVTKYVQMQMCCLLFLSCWWSGGTAHHEREGSSTSSSVHGSYWIKLTLGHHLQSWFHYFLKWRFAGVKKASVSFSQKLSPPPQCHVAPAQLLIAGVDGGWEDLKGMWKEKKKKTNQQHPDLDLMFLNDARKQLAK